MKGRWQGSKLGEQNTLDLDKDLLYSPYFLVWVIQITKVIEGKSIPEEKDFGAYPTDKK